MVGKRERERVCVCECLCVSCVRACIYALADKRERECVSMYRRERERCKNGTIKSVHVCLIPYTQILVGDKFVCMRERERECMCVCVCD